MMDQHLRPFYHRIFIAPLIRQACFERIHPITLTLLACVFGVLSLPLLVLDDSLLAAISLLISGFLDTLDGALARHLHLTSPQGAVLDIVCDRLVEFSVILGLYFVDPEGRGLWIILMLGSILLCVTTFLVVGIFTPNHGQKSFYYSPGLIERAEAFMFFFFMILFPPTFFFPVALLFVILTSLTALFRCWQFFSHQ